MNILHANIKHLYQKRSFWLVGLFFGFAAFGIIGTITQAITNNRQGCFSTPVILMFFISVFIASLPIDVLTKPFSYCLPGHRNIPRQFLFFVGLVLSFLWSLIFLFYPDLTIIETILACLSAFSILTVFYWLGAWCVFSNRSWSVVFAVIPFIMLGNALLNMNVIVEHAIIETPLLMICLGGLANFLAWRYWGRSNLARRFCGVLWMVAFDAWNREKMSKLTKVRLAEKDKKKPNSTTRVSSGVEWFFISRISRAETGSLQQYIWGALYKSFGSGISQQRREWMGFLAIMLPTLCFLCYMPGAGKNIIFFMPGMMIAYMSLWVHSSLLICGGRRQRFWSALTLAVTAGILITAVVVLLALATHLLESIMPQLTVRGHEFTFNALNINLSFVPFLMVPVALTIGLIFHKNTLLAMLFTILLFMFLFNIAIFRAHNNRLMQIGTVHVMITLLCGWAVFIAVLRYVSMRRPLG